jgi:hypothetical protein
MKEVPVQSNNVVELPEQNPVQVVLGNLKDRISDEEAGEIHSMAILLYTKQGSVEMLVSPNMDLPSMAVIEKVMSVQVSDFVRGAS